MKKSQKIRTEYLRLLPILERSCAEIQALLSNLPMSDFMIETNIKKLPRLQEKKLNKLTDLSDLARGRVYFSTNFSHQKAIKLIVDLLKDHVKDIDWKRLMNMN